LYAQQGEARLRRADVFALALRGDLGGEAAVHHDNALVVADQPHEIVHGHGRVVWIAADEVLVAARVAPRVADREDFVFRQRHQPSRSITARIASAGTLMSTFARSVCSV